MHDELCYTTYEESHIPITKVRTKIQVVQQQQYDNYMFRYEVTHACKEKLMTN